MKKLRNKGVPFWIILWLLLTWVVFVTASCKTRKVVEAETSDIASEGVMKTEEVSTSEEKLIEVSLATWCDSISVEFAADSIVTPKGLVIHRPIVKSKKANPGAIAKANSRILTSDSVSSTASVRHDRNFGQSVKTEEQSEPPEPFSIIGLLVIIVVIAISGIITISFISRKRRP